MNIQRTKAENLNSSKSYFHLIGVKHAGLSWLLQLRAACTSHQGFMWAPSHGLPSFLPLWNVWYSFICSVLTFRFEVQCRKRCTRGSGCAPWASTILLMSWICLKFSLLLSPSWEGPAPHPPSLYFPGFPCHDSYCTKCGKNKEPALQVVVYLAHCDFQNKSWSGLRHGHVNEKLRAKLQVPLHSSKAWSSPRPPHSGKKQLSRSHRPTEPGVSPPTQTALTPFRNRTEGKRLLLERDFFLSSVMTPQEAVFEGNVADRKSQEKLTISKASLSLMSKMCYCEFRTRLRILTSNEKPTWSNSSLPCWRHCEISYYDSFHNTLEFCLPAGKAKCIIFSPPDFPKLSVLNPFFLKFFQSKMNPTVHQLHISSIALWVLVMKKIPGSNNMGLIP